MSRVSNNPISVPKNVEITITGSEVTERERINIVGKTREKIKKENKIKRKN